MDAQKTRREPRREPPLGRRTRTWAKIEILLGVLTFAIGLVVIVRPPAEPALMPYVVLGAALMMLGGYLAMAGHRSHLYIAMNRLAAHLDGERGASSRETGDGNSNRS